MVDHSIRKGFERDNGKSTGALYLHRNLQPLDEVDLSTPEEKGQGALAFGDECEGVCGV